MHRCAVLHFLNIYKNIQNCKHSSLNDYKESLYNILSEGEIDWRLDDSFTSSRFIAQFWLESEFYFQRYIQIYMENIWINISKSPLKFNFRHRDVLFNAGEIEHIGSYQKHFL